MALRKPSSKKVGVKVLVKGQTGAGKSQFGLSFPKIAALDSEAGLARYEGRPKGKNLEFIDNTMSVADMEDTFTEIETLLDEDSNAVQTLLIDSETKFYQNLQHSCLETEEKRARKKGGDVNDTNLSVRSWGRIKQVASRLQNLKIDLSAKGVNVISVSQVEDVKEKIGENFVKVGEKAVMAKNSEYDYDIIINLFTEEVNDEVVYKGQIEKDRTEVTKVGQIIENPTYEIWKDHIEGNSNAETLNTSLTKDLDKDIKTLEAEDEEKESGVEGINITKNKELLEDIKALFPKASKESQKAVTDLFATTGFKTADVEKVETKLYIKATELLKK